MNQNWTLKLVYLKINKTRFSFSFFFFSEEFYLNYSFYNKWEKKFQLIGGGRGGGDKYHFLVVVHILSSKLCLNTLLFYQYDTNNNFLKGWFNSIFENK